MVCKPPCVTGQICRRGYTAKRRNPKTQTVKEYAVRPTCIRDRGRPGKGKPKWTVTRGELGKFGYHVVEKNPRTGARTIVPVAKRRAALRRAIAGTPPKTYASGRTVSSRGRVVMRLNAIRNYISNQPEMEQVYNAFAQDIKYVQELKKLKK